MDITGFVPFPKLHRLSRDMIVTEKIDGTNAQIVIGENADGVFARAGSRTRWITPEQDNFGFARWVKENEDALIEGLGFGQHFGEWWGAGIQRGYGADVKRFSLFNTSRWKSPQSEGQSPSDTTCYQVPICHVVPTLCIRTFSTADVDAALANLVEVGSYAAPGFMQPEGVVVFHVASGALFKKTLDKNDWHKGVA